MPKIEVATEIAPDGKAAIVMKLSGEKATTVQMITMLAAIVNAAFHAVREIDVNKGANGDLFSDFNRHISKGHYESSSCRVVSRTEDKQ